ncbi:hypothetical protein [Mycolicibacterium septicum]|uniref:hypothetical protein n=1 Tax=Mycolicibacterium septicum TaxID=98668 RepID=UPI002360F60D|nr:hypothetical protein [Mycolicibacterium septicum]
MNMNVTGFYHDPPLFLVENPIGEDRLSVDFSAFFNEAYRHSTDDGLQIMATVEGLFAFDFSKLPEYAWEETGDTSVTSFDKRAEVVVRRTRAMNALLAFLYTHEMMNVNYSRERMVITPDLTIPMDRLDPMASKGFGNQWVAHLSASSYPSTYRPGVPYPFDGRLSGRGASVAADIVKNAGHDLNKLMNDHGSEGVLLIDLFHRASKAFQDHDHSLSLINNWTVIERLLNDLWGQLQSDYKTRDGVAFLSRERLQRLQDGRTFTASVMSEMLSFLDYLPRENYDDMTKIRKTRNEWMHGLKVVDANTAGMAISVAERMLKQVKDITVRGSAGRRLYG